jgi:hypothetical protein
MNFRAAPRSEPKPMLRRIFLTILVWALAAGFVAPGEAASGGMDCDQYSVQLEGDATGSEGMAASACVVACHAGACIASAPLNLQSAVFPSPSPDRPERAAADHRRAPETAPPKPFAA